MCRQHASSRMTNHDRLFDAELSQQFMGVAGKLLESELVSGGFARLAEPDLIRRYHTIAGRDQMLNGRLPGGGTEVLSVQWHRRLPVWAVRLDVEIGHLQRLPLRRECKVLNRERIVEPLQLWPVGRCFLVWLGRQRPHDQSHRKGYPREDRLHPEFHSSPANS